MGFEGGGQTEEKEKEKEKFVLCESIGHRPLWGRCPKRRKSAKFLKFKKNWYWKQCIWVKNIPDMNFIHLLKKIGSVKAKNPKPPYPNEVKVQFFKEWPTLYWPFFKRLNFNLIYILQFGGFRS